MLELIQQPFLFHAIIGNILVCLACALMGPFVYVRKMSFLAGGISHALLGGLGLAVFLNINPMLGALGGAIVSAFILGFVNLRFPKNEDTLISALWSGGMAIGMIFIALKPGYATDLMNYLFGNILLLSSGSLVYMAWLCLFLLICVSLFYQSFVAISFDAEYAEIRGLPVKLLYYFFLCLLAISIVLLVQAVGMVLVIAFLTIPAAISKWVARSIFEMIVLSFLIGVAAGMCGLWASYDLNWPSGASMILSLLTFYALAITLKLLKQKTSF